jgi:hypothetical protein
MGWLTLQRLVVTENGVAPVDREMEFVAAFTEAFGHLPMAEEVCMIATRQMFYARLPQVKGTAGGVAFLLDEVMPASPAYRWTLNHTMRLHDPLELFPTFIAEAGYDAAP